MRIKLKRFPGSTIKPAILNQDVVENHFCQLRAANGQNENPTYWLTQATQNAIIFGDSTLYIDKCDFSLLIITIIQFCLLVDFVETEYLLNDYVTVRP